MYKLKYNLGMSRLGFKHPTFRLRGQRSNPLRHRRGMVNRAENIIHRQLINSASNLNTDYEDFIRDNTENAFISLDLVLFRDNDISYVENIN